MSTTNFEYIGRSLDLLQEGLSPFIEREVAKKDISKEDILNKLGNPRFESDKPINRWDVSFLLKAMLILWREVFFETLSSADRGLILESREIRNKFHHRVPGDILSDEDTDRALDTIRRVLDAISASQSKEVGRLKQDLSSRQLPSPEDEGKRPSDKTEKIIGIDLGTTNSCVAISNGEAHWVLEDRKGGGGPIIPSTVGFRRQADSEIKISVGKKAWKEKYENPKNTIYAIKRLIGRRFDDEEVQRHIENENIEYSIVRADNGNASVKIHDEYISPEEISAHILHKMKQIATKNLGEEANAAVAAVIAVPAYFNNSQRQATKDAGRIAGLDVKRIINEPTAAALHYAMENWQEGQKVAFYDMGGGTFDISIIEMAEIDGKRRIDVKSTNGDATLGGLDFDARIIKHIYAEIKKEHGLDISNKEDQPDEIVSESEIQTQAEEAKKDLSEEDNEETKIYIRPFVGTKKIIKMILTRSKLESLVDDLIARTIEPCRVAMEDAGISASDIDKIVFVGGQTRMPKVQEVAESIFGKKPKWDVDPDKAVALGAAILGRMLTDRGGSLGLYDVTPQDVTPHSLGIKLASGKIRKLINKGTIIPTRVSKIFTTDKPDRRAVTVHVFQGEGEQAESNESLEAFHLKGIRPIHFGGSKPEIEVSIDIDADNILNVSAKDKATGNVEFRITKTTGLKFEEIERLREKMMRKYGC